MSYNSRNGPKKDDSQKQIEQQLVILERIIKKAGNDNCADCGQKGPRWASINLGIFVCIRCSGIHRNMGTHISKVKSVSLDKWTPEMIRTVDIIGNYNSRRIYEAKLPSNYPRPKESDTYGVEQWIRDKYDRKRWYDPSVEAEIMSGRGGSVTSSGQAADSPSQSDEARRLRREQRRRQREERAENEGSQRGTPKTQSPAPGGFFDPQVSAAVASPVVSAPGTPSAADLFFSDLTQSQSPVQTRVAPPAVQSTNFFDIQTPAPVAQAAPAPVVSIPSPAPAQKINKDSIMSLFRNEQNNNNNNNNGNNNLNNNNMNMMGLNNMGFNQNTGMNQMGYVQNTGMNQMNNSNNMGFNTVQNTGMGYNTQGLVNNNMGYAPQNMNAVPRPNVNTGMNLGNNPNLMYNQGVPQNMNNGNNMGWAVPQVNNGMVNNANNNAWTNPNTVVQNNGWANPNVNQNQNLQGFSSVGSANAFGW